MPWLCSQIGAREHYAVPRALQTAGVPCQLMTDAWAPPASPWRMLKGGLRERYHPALATMPVQAWTAGLIGFELRARLRQQTGWRLTLQRNAWFQRRAARFLSTLPRVTGEGRPVLFGYSYAALSILRQAKERGWWTILGQIDPAEEEEKIVARLVAKHPSMAGSWRPAPAEYWDQWREECAVADHIVVNSRWSAQALEKSGIPATKMSVLPLAFEPPAQAVGPIRHYPPAFDRARPLRVLFLGQIILRKGVAEILEAVSLLEKEPVEFWFAGRVGITVPEKYRGHPAIRWLGPVPRSQAQRYYQDADVFLFPTWSDGFGLTQLEAQAWKLPIVASRNCGDVVRQGVNGLLLEEISGERIAENLRRLLQAPEELVVFSSQSGVGDEFGMATLGRRLAGLRVFSESM